MSKSVKKEILASEYSSEQVLAVNTNGYLAIVVLMGKKFNTFMKKVDTYSDFFQVPYSMTQ